MGNFSKRRQNGFRKYYKNNSRKSAFGGIVKSVEEVAKLSKKIRTEEVEEFAKFEEMFDADLRNL